MADTASDSESAVRRLHARAMRTLRRPIPPPDALHLTTMCAIRERELSLQMLPSEFETRVRQDADALALTQTELECLVGSTRHEAIETMLTEAMRRNLTNAINDANVSAIINLISTQLRHAMVDPLVTRNWKTHSCRLAAVVAFGFDDPIDALRVVIGPFAEADARRLLAHCNRFDESEADSARLLDAVDTAARALSECVA